jgi:hypothetical protein
MTGDGPETARGSGGGVDDYSDGGGDTTKTTTTARYRWRYLSTAVALLVVGLFAVVTLAQTLGPAVAAAVGAPDGAAEAMGGVSPTPGNWATLTAAFVLVLVYTLGSDTYQAYKSASGGDAEAPGDGGAAGGEPSGAGVDPDQLRAAFERERDNTADVYRDTIEALRARVEILEEQNENMRADLEDLEDFENHNAADEEADP